MELIKHISKEELKKIVRKEKDRHILERLLFINQLYFGSGVPEACQRMCISEQTGYEWLEKWNGNGYDGLFHDTSGGRPSKLSDEEKENLKQRLTSKANWITSEVRALIKKDFGAVYSIRHVIRMLREFGMHYAKPYPQDYRKPDNAKELLRNAITEAVEGISTAVVGFFDEASPQTRDNKQRFWSFSKPRIVKNTNRYKANTFGFYPINGNEVVDFKENSKIPSVKEFFRLVSERNHGKHIVMFLDNFRSHVANETKTFAKSVGITLVFLPKYSPDLNPIEFIWKSVRRMLSQIFAKSEWSFKETIRTIFHRLARKKSFMAGWEETFGHLLSNSLCH
jgi:transposase